MSVQRLLTFRLDQEQRQRIRARLTREGRTMSEVVTHGLRQYVQSKGAAAAEYGKAAAEHGKAVAERGKAAAEHGKAAAEHGKAAAEHGKVAAVAYARGGAGPDAGGLVLPDRIAAALRELRSTGRSELLSATLAALHEAGWPLRPLADALGISRQAVQRRVHRAATALRGHVTHCEPPPPFPHRRMASPAGLRPHLTVKIDHALRSSAHRAAAEEGRSLTQVIEAILDRYLRHGLADADQPSRPVSRPARRSR